jgi:hypothetical protein
LFMPFAAAIGCPERKILGHSAKKESRDISIAQVYIRFH